MRQIFIKAIALFFLLWLPLYSGGAAAMVICKQTLHQSMAQPQASGNDDSTHHADSSSPDVEHKHHHEGQNQGTGFDMADCNQCGLCHVTCSPWVTSTDLSPASLISTPISALSEQTYTSLTIAPNDRPPLLAL